MKLKLVPVVLSGGSGTRLWPLSTDKAPKQFHALSSTRSMLQDALARFLQSDEDLQVLPPVIIGSARHRGLIEEQVKGLGASGATVVLEPFGRNSAPAAAIAARLAERMDPEALVLLMPADHHMPDTAGFRRTVLGAAAAAREDIVVFGVQPTGPETGYGYVAAGENLQGAVRRVARFVEKPDLDTAKSYLADGRYLWNAGIFLFSPAVLLREMQACAPEVLAAADKALDAARTDGRRVELDPGAFAQCPSISIDYAVMERTRHAAVMPMGAEWTDVGSWSELWRQGPLDGQDNNVRGDAIVIDTEGCLVWAGDRTVGVVGVKDLIIVQTEAAVMVVPKSRAQDVKLLVEALKARAVHAAS